MNVLTKVFVVLVTVFAIVLVSLVVPFVANVENFQERIAAAETRTRAAEAVAATRQSQLDMEKRTFNDQLTAKDSLIGGLRRENDNLRGEVSTTRGDLERSKAENAGLQANLANFSQSHSQLTQIQKQLQDELATRRQNSIDLSKQLADLEQANNEQASLIATLKRQVNYDQEQIVALKEELKMVSDKLGLIPNDVVTQYTNPKGDEPTGPPPFEDVAVRGQVTDVRKVGDETTLVQLNIGSLSGVNRNKRYLLHRGEEYLGSIVILTVDEQQCAGRILTQKTGATIAPGDQAWSGPVR